MSRREAQLDDVVLSTLRSIEAAYGAAGASAEQVADHAGLPFADAAAALERLERSGLVWRLRVSDDVQPVARVPLYRAIAPADRPGRPGQ